MAETPTIAAPHLGRLLDYGQILLRRRWIVIAATVSVLAAVVVGTFRQTPIYRAAATVQIERVDPNIMKFQEIATYDPSFLSYQDYYQTQYKLLQSRAVAARVVRRLNLATEPAFQQSNTPGPMSRIWKALTNPFRSRIEESTLAVEPDRPWVDALLSGLRIEPIRNSHLVEVAFLSPDPSIAAKVANGVAEAYIGFGMDTRVDTSETAQDFLNEQIDSLRKEVARLERATQDYGESKEIIPTGSRENTTLSALEDLQKAFTAAQADRAEKEAAYTALQTTPDEGVPQVLGSLLIQNLTQQAAELERDRTEMSRHFKPDWPALARLTSKLEQARERLDEETVSTARSARSAAETSYRAALAREKNLSALLENQKRTALKLSQDSIEYTNLRSEVEKKRETLDQLLKRQTEIALSSHLTDSRQSNTRVIDPARVPTAPWRPNRKLNVLLGLLFGLGLGVGFALLAEHLDNSIKSVEEIRRLADYAAIGVIPEHKPGGPRPLRKDPAGASTTSADLITHTDPRSPLAEAYKELRTATLLASPDQPPRTILVTSCLPREGKSQTCLNLSIALAQSGKRVLLVDTDLRRPRLHRALDLDNDSGISTFLSGNAPVEDLIRETLVPGLYALTSGPIPPNPSELLGSRNFLTLARELAETGGFDHIVFDSPPLMSVADPIVIATALDGTIVVVQSGRTPREALVRSSAKLRHANAKVLGAVLNSVVESDRAYYYRARYPYTGEGDGEPKADAGA